MELKELRKVGQAIENGSIVLEEPRRAQGFKHLLDSN
jgi:hypothetical protein